MALSDIFSPFTGSAYKEAADKQRAYLGQLATGIGGLTSGATNQGLAALQGGLTSGTAALYPAIDLARSDITGGLSSATGAITDYTGKAAGALTGAQDPALAALQSGVTSAVGAYDPLRTAGGNYAQYYQPGISTYNALLGLGGPQAAEAAMSTFQTSPGYNFQVQQGLEALSRNANVGGMLAGGNLLRESQQYGSNLANLEFQKYLENLYRPGTLYAPLEQRTLADAASGQAQAYLTGGTGAANIYTGTGSRLADLYSGAGRTLGSTYMTGAQQLADFAAKQGLTVADLSTRTGMSEADLIRSLTSGQIGALGQLAGPYTSSYGTEASGTTAAAKNLWDLGGAALTFGAGAGWIPGTSGSFGPWAPKPTPTV